MPESARVRTRIAPSPTGRPHIGTGYIALFNYAFTRRHGGSFILRIEDTDQARSTRESEQAILDGLRWLGMQWNEGPDVGGPFGPYRQSERSALYRKHCDRLVAEGHAYPCFCTPERLAKLRAEQQAAKVPTPGYDGLCAKLDTATVKSRIAAGESHVIRMRVPTDGECVFRDRLRGEIRIPWSQVDAQVLLKADGLPTYHLANVVDDHEMQITHVIRGEEWISSTPKHILLYQLFAWTPPEFAHLPLLRNPDKSKLSKRKNPTSILYYRDAGFLPEAVLNYLALMAYSMPDGREIFPIGDFVSSFNLDRVSPGGPIFDFTKLTNFNAQYIRKMTPSQLGERLKQWRLNDESWNAILPLAQPRLNTLSDFVPMASYIFADRVPVTVDILVGKADGAQVARTLKTVQWELERLSAWNRDTLKNVFAKIAEKENAQLKQLLPPVFAAISGSTVSLPLYESMEVMGLDLCLRRLAYAFEILAVAGHELKGKALKEFESAYEKSYGRRD